MFLAYLFYSACDQLEIADERRECHVDRIVKALVLDNILYAVAIFLMMIPVQRLIEWRAGRQAVKIVMARGVCSGLCKRPKALDQDVTVKARMERRLSKR